MVRRTIWVDDHAESGGVPLALPPGPVRPDVEPSNLPVLRNSQLLSADERASVSTQDVAVRFLLGFSPTSARQRAAQLRAYFAHCARQDVDPLDADEAFVAAYADELHTDPSLTSGAIGVRLGTVRGFYRYATDDRILAASPAEGTASRAHAMLVPPLTIDSGATAAHEAAAAFLIGYSENTRLGYQVDLRSFFGWCFRSRLNPMDANRPHIEAWRLHLEEQGKSPASSNRAVSTIRSFYKYCVEEEILSRSPAASVRLRRVGQTRPISDGLDRHEAIAFLDAARGISPIYHAVIALMLLNGLRANEVCSPGIERMSTVRGHRLIYVDRKGYADQWPVPLAPYTAGALDAYLGQRAAYIPRGHPEWDADTGPVFVSAHGKQLLRGVVWNWVRRTSLLAFPQRRRPVHPHELRATFITLGLDAGSSLRDVQDAAGHANPATTRRYDRGRHSLDRHSTYTLATYLATGATRAPRAYDETPPEGLDLD